MKYSILNKVHLLFLATYLFLSLITVAGSTPDGKQIIVVIDPGHGGKDPGAVGKGIREKDVVLGIGLKLGQYLKENFSDVKVVYTRSTDVFIPLIDRSRIANRNKADLFISIHANSASSPSARGTETFALGLARSNENLEVAKKENSVILLEEDYHSTYEGFDPNSAESYIMFANYQEGYMKQSLSFADDIQHQFDARKVSINRGVKQAGFLVLQQSSMPSVLIETGFISNASEANYLKSEQGQDAIAISIFEAFKKFKARNYGPGATVVAQTRPEKNIRENTIEKEAEPGPKIVEKEVPETSVPAKFNVENKEDKTQTAATNTATDQEIFYSVQIAAGTVSVEPVPANFKGLKNVRREKTDKFFRFYVGKESSIEGATTLLQQIAVKYPQAFIVSFVNGNRVIIK